MRFLRASQGLNRNAAPRSAERSAEGRSATSAGTSVANDDTANVTTQPARPRPRETCASQRLTRLSVPAIKRDDNPEFETVHEVAHAA